MNYDIIRCKLAEMNWNTALSSNDLNTNIVNLYDAFNTVIEKHISLGKQSSNSYPVWYDLELIKAIENKKQAHQANKSLEVISN